MSKRSIRLYECSTGKVKRVSRTRILADGDILLWPKTAGQSSPSPLAHPTQPDIGSSQLHQWLLRISPSIAAKGGQGSVSQESWRKQFIIGSSSQFVFINKPAGLEVQGGGGSGVSSSRGGGGGGGGGQLGSLAIPSLKGMIDEGFFNISPDDKLKLVHRLDQRVSGVMVLARGQDAAAYISQSFR